jgi:hypothetical protein
MTATFEIPDPLYRKLASKSARLGADVSSITLKLYRQWVDEVPSEAIDQSSLNSDASVDATATLEAWFQMCDAAMAHAPAGPTAREDVAAGRNRLES